MCQESIGAQKTKQKERTQSSRFRSLYVVLRRALHRRLHSHWFSKHSADSFVRQHLSLVRPQRKVWDVLSMDARGVASHSTSLVASLILLTASFSDTLRNAPYRRFVGDVLVLVGG